MKNPFDLIRPGRRHHRLEPRHRPLGRRNHGSARRQGGGLQPQGGRLRGGRRRASRRRAARPSSSPATSARKNEVEALINGTLKQWGRIDTLVCNAAINPYYGPLAGLPDEAFDKIMSSNVKSNIWLCNLAIPGMAEKGGGSVVIVSSIGGLRGTGILGAYGISKAADFALARNLAVEWGPKNIRINCIAPGLVKTDFARALWEDEKNLKPRLQTTPLRRIGEPDEIGGIVAFLASQGRDLHDRLGHRRRRRRDDRLEQIQQARRIGRTGALAVLGRVVERQAVVAREVDQRALGQRGDGEQRVDAQRARNDRAVDDVEALVHVG